MPGPTIKEQYRLSETEIRKQVMDYLDRLPERDAHFTLDRQPMRKPGFGTYTSANGSPDIRGTYKGWSLAIELKRNNGEISLKQFQWLNRHERAGGVSIVATCAQDVQRRLSELKDKRNA